MIFNWKRMCELVAFRKKLPSRRRRSQRSSGGSNDSAAVFLLRAESLESRTLLSSATPTTPKFTSAASVTYGNSETFSVTLTPGAGGVSGSVSFSAYDTSGHFLKSLGTANVTASTKSANLVIAGDDAAHYLGAGDYQVYATYSPSGNSKTTGGTAIESFTVNQASLAVKATSINTIYGSAPALAYTYSGLVNGDASASFTGQLASTGLTTAGTNNVGNYDITQGTLAAVGNYKIGTFYGSRLAVAPAPLTVNANPKTTDYGTVPNLDFSYSGLTNGDTSATFTGTLASDGLTATGTNHVGKYDITQGTLTATGNYRISVFHSSVLSLAYARLGIVANHQDMTYGGAVPQLTYSFVGLVNGDSSASMTGALSTSATSSSDVGNYAITLGTLNVTRDYYLAGFQQADLKISPAPLVVTALNHSTTYGGPMHGLAFTYTGLVNGDAIASLTGELASDGITATGTNNVGTYDITQGTLTAIGNYTIEAFQTGSLSITPAGLVVTVDYSNTTYGTVPNLTYTYTGLKNGDTSADFTGALASDGLTPNGTNHAGVYIIKQGTLAATGNYQIVRVNPGLLEIQRAPLTVVEDNQMMTYGSAVPALTYQLVGLVNGDTSASTTGALTTTATSSSNVGFYTIFSGDLTITGDYYLAQIRRGIVQITPALLTVTADTFNLNVGDGIPTLTYSYTGLVNGDTTALFTGGLTTTATQTSSAGTYSITQGDLLASGNYEIGTFIEGGIIFSATSSSGSASNGTSGGGNSGGSGGHNSSGGSSSSGGSAPGDSSSSGGTTGDSGSSPSPAPSPAPAPVPSPSPDPSLNSDTSSPSSSSPSSDSSGSSSSGGSSPSSPSSQSPSDSNSPPDTPLPA